MVQTVDALDERGTGIFQRIGQDRDGVASLGELTLELADAIFERGRALALRDELAALRVDAADDLRDARVLIVL